MNNWKIEIGNWKLIRQGFTLVELLIVVAILGILAAIVLPEFQGHIQQAKESAAKDNLRILRETIERYALEHNGIPPGYINDVPANGANAVWFMSQLTDNGYVNEFPENPFNNSNLVMIYQDNQTIPDTPITGPGWLYHPATKTIILNTTGYMDY